MKQIFQSLKDGKTTVQDMPSPYVSTGHLLIRSSTSLVSAGTERMLVDFGKANILQKARQQPDKVKLVVEKMVTNGVFILIGIVLNFGKSVQSNHQR